MSLCACLRESTGQPGPMGRLGPSSAITVMVGSNNLSQWEVSNPLVLACLTIRGFETWGLDFQGPTWLPRLELEDRTGCSTDFHFSDLEVQKGHPLWRPVLYHGTEGSEDGRKIDRKGSTVGSRATNPLQTAFGLAPQTQVLLSVCHQGCPCIAQEVYVPVYAIRAQIWNYTGFDFLSPKLNWLPVDLAGVPKPGERHSLSVFPQSSIQAETSFSGRRVKKAGIWALGNTFPQQAVGQERSDQVRGKAYKQPRERIFLAASLFTSCRREHPKPCASVAKYDTKFPSFPVITQGEHSQKSRLYFLPQFWHKEVL